MAKKFDVLEHTADVGIVAYGQSLKEAFSHAALGLFTLISDLKQVRETVEREVEVTAPDQESLLVSWLNELIYIFDVENILFRRFEVVELKPDYLRARVYGEKVDLARHEIKIGVKAATYHLLQIEKNKKYRIQVLFDI